MIFPIEYDRSRGLIVHLRSFDQAKHAEEARLELELALGRKKIEREVVLLEAASEAALRKTHRRYFEKLEELASPTSAQR
jgi:hypothetical protein